MAEPFNRARRRSEFQGVQIIKMVKSTTSQANRSPSTGTGQGPRKNTGIRTFSIWICAITALLLLDHFFGPYLGLTDRLTDERGSGRIIFLLFAASLCVHAISTTGRPLSYFGLAIENGWPRSFAIAAILGASAPAALYFLGFVSGTFTLGPIASPTSYLSVLLTALVAGTIAAYLQEIIYRGYIGTAFRDWFGNFGIILAALVFALTFRLDLNIWLEPINLVPSAFAMFLFALVQHLARIFHGNLVFPIGLASGWLYVDIFTRQTKLFLANASGQDAFSMISPDPDLRKSLLLWLVLAAIILVYLVLINRKSRENSRRAAITFRQIESKGLATSIVKLAALLNPVSNLSVLAPIDVWIRVLWHSRFRVHPVYWPRLCLILATSAGASILNLPERILAPFFLRNRPARDPVVILGVHRSGTTFLHELLALDPQFVAPKGYQVFNPTGFLLIGRLSQMLLGALLPWRRPIDSVEFSLETPNEDEFGIALSTPYSPYWSFTFPREADHFDRYIFPDLMSATERAAWKRALSTFLKKVMLFKPGIPLLKSPYHTARIDLITELYPDARFIHIHRNPFKVYQSSVHFQENFVPLFQLQFAETGNAFGDRVLNKNYLAVENRYIEQAKKLPDGQVAEIKYEELASRTIEEVERVYAEIGLQFTAQYRQILENYFAVRTSYKRNKYETMDANQKQIVHQKLKPLLQLWNYSTD